MKWPFEDQLQYQLGLEEASPEVSIWCVVLFTDARSSNQGMEMGVAPLTITPSDPRAPVLVTLHPTGLYIFTAEGGIFLPGDTTVIPLQWGEYCHLATLGSPCLCIHSQRGSSLLPGVIDPDHHGEARWPLQMQDTACLKCRRLEYHHTL